MESQILFFFMTRRDKITCREIIFYFSVLSKTNFDVIRHDVHVHTLHVYKIH